MAEQLDIPSSVNVIFHAAEEMGVYEANGFRLELGADGDPQVKVRDVETGFLVAYSAMNADYESSMDEFIADYLLTPWHPSSD